MINIAKLHRELEAAGLPVVGVAADGRMDWSRKLTEAEADQVKVILEAHDPVDYGQVRQEEAEKAAAAVENWSSWTAEKAAEYINANVTTVASARGVLVSMAKLVIALRDQTWPELAGNGK
jgi:hypothetical protein